MKPLITLAMLVVTLGAQPGIAQIAPVEMAPAEAAPVPTAPQQVDPGQGGAPQDAGRAPAQAGPLGVGPHAVSSVDWEAQRYHSRPLVIFADSPEHPDFQRQLQLVERDLAALEDRRVVVVLDSDPAAASDWRRRLRPNGFSLVLLDTDLKPVTRKLKPVDMREIGRTIDRLPSRRQELAEQFPGRSGR